MAYADIPHLRSNAASVAKVSKPSVAAGATGIAGTTPTAVSVTGVDEAGIVGITTGSGSLAAGTIATVTFATPYTVAPTAVIVNDNAGLAAYGTASKTALSVKVHTAATASTAYVFNYLVVGGV